MTTKHKTTLLALGAVIGLAGAGIASASSAATAAVATQASCDTLLKQADSALAAHKGDAAKGKAARQQRDQGEKECKAGNHAKGVEHLRHAITDLGMKPVD